MIAIAFSLMTCAAPLPQQPGGAIDTDGVEVVCKSQALIRGSRILLGDLVDILPPGEEAHRLEQIPFGPRPAAGFSRVITQHEVLQHMVMAGEDAGNLEMAGAREIVVQPAFTEITPQDIRDAAETALQAAIAQEGGDVEFELVTRVRHLRVPPGREGIDFRARVRDGQIGVGRAIVDLALEVDEETYKVIPLQFKLRRFHEVLRITRTISQGEPLTEGNLQVVRQELSQASGLFLQSFEDVRGKVARRNLQANRLLYLGDITDPAIVHRGQLVTVVAANQRVSVTMQGVAHQSGAKGDVIQVVNQSSGGVVSAVVYAPGVVVVRTAR